MSEPAAREIEAAVRILRNGGLVAFPTETVYGLGAAAANPQAVRRIFEAKGRPADHPLIVHIARVDDLDYWARDIPETAWRLAERYWPGPLTLILQRRHAPLEVTGGQETVGLRVPGHPTALALLKAFGDGIAAPSANRFGRLSPTTATHVSKELMGKVDMILDGGPCQVGVESTILSLAGPQPRLLRPGAISVSALQTVLDEEIVVSDLRRQNTTNAAELSIDAPLAWSSVDDIRAPGMLASHYAPTTPLELWPQAALLRRADELAQSGGSKAAALVIDGGRPQLGNHPNVFPVPMPGDPAGYAQRLYAVLRMLDGSGFDLLLAETPPDTEAWHAVNDRLRRASRNRGEAGRAS